MGRYYTKVKSYTRKVPKEKTYEEDDDEIDLNDDVDSNKIHIGWR